MAYSAEIAPLARRQIRKMERRVQAAILDSIDLLCEDPRLRTVKKLTGGWKGFYRIDAGPKKNYRIIYDIQDSVLIIVIVSVADRKDAYR